MSEQISVILKRKLEDTAHSGIDATTRLNSLKEELQFYVLNFIYHHPQYSKWIMYGGSALRIIHKLDRMSVDLDFEVVHPVTERFLEEFKEEIEEYFLSTYAAEANFFTAKITHGRGLLLKFTLGEELDMGLPSRQIHVKVDLNNFVAPKTVTERWPINHDQLSFVIITYNMASLMASKLAAIFLRGTRGVGNEVYDEKGRDIYDLLWYMGKKAVPDFDYLIAKGIDVKDPRALFVNLTLKMNKVKDKNLEQDLSPLFMDKTYIQNWLKNWRESFMRLQEEYKIRTLKDLERVEIHFDIKTDVYSFILYYATEEAKPARIVYRISDYWMDLDSGNLQLEVDKKIEDKIFSSSGLTNTPTTNDKLKRYATLFHDKTEKYLKRNSRVLLGDLIVTKFIRMTADNLNQEDQILLNKPTLVSCDLDDLLK